MIRLVKKGKIDVKTSAEIEKSRLGIGFEKLDRGVFEPEKAYDLVAATGVKYARIQSGWMRTENEKGVYDFAWIDSIVDNLLGRKIEPWINLVYGNPLYTEVAKQFFGAVGCPPVPGESMEAWLRYVKALTAHMKSRVSKFEIWNEPDAAYSWRLDGKTDGVKGTPDGREYGEFAKATALAIKEVYPDAYVIGFALSNPKHIAYVSDAMKTGLCDVIDAASYHCYNTSTINRIRRNEVFAALIHSFNPKIDIIQGESGTQSEYSYAGALHSMNWTQDKQTKHLLRLIVADMALDCSLVSYFSAMDMIEALHGLLSDRKSYLDYGFFGVISADFDENGVATGVYSKKPSFAALQNAASLLCGNAKRDDIPYIFTSGLSKFVNGSDYDGAELMSFGFRLDDGSRLLAYWRETDILTSSFEGTATVTLAADRIPELIDLRDGSIYEIPEGMYTQSSGEAELLHIPLRDYPLALRW